jgi:hypothetical protein|tara:strand:+ start:1761 stop:2189 length:429 start_codon:yes stop_codon:yes gene_type:complete
MLTRASTNYLEGDVYYAYIFDYKDKFDRWSMAMSLQGDQVGHAKKIGLKVKQDEDKFEGLPYVQLKTNYKPEVFDKDGADYNGPTMLAAGTKGVAKLTSRPYDNKFGKGITTFMSAVKLTKVVEYKKEGADLDSSEDSEEAF